jgi:hypothetical protein
MFRTVDHVRRRPFDSPNGDAARFPIRVFLEPVQNFVAFSSLFVYIPSFAYIRQTELMPAC